MPIRTISSILAGLKEGHCYRARLKGRDDSCLIKVDDASHGIPFFRELDPISLEAFGEVMVLAPTRFAEAVLAAE